LFIHEHHVLLFAFSAITPTIAKTILILRHYSYSLMLRA